MPNTLPPTESHHPATFQSRGVAVPFTTPLLAGTRVRESKRSGIELVVPSPSGGRGVYILQWSGVRALCNPTVHDTILFRLLANLGVVSPGSIRDAALEVALAGHAGRAASAAASITIAHDRAQRLRTLFLLSMRLLEQVDPRGLKITSMAQRTADLDQKASSALHRIAPSFGRTPAQLAASLVAISNIFTPVGVTADDRDARIPRLLTRLAEAHADLAQWLAEDPDNDIASLGRAVMVAIARACESGQTVLDNTRLTLIDPTALLKRWITDVDGVMALATRCDWLLDGWERIALIWLAAGTNAQRRAALLEMAPLLPVLPREVMEWPDVVIPAEVMEPGCRVVSREDTWRSGSAAFALIERNERLFAACTTPS